MRYVLALIGGFALTLAVFVAGAVMATVYFVAEPRSNGPAADTAAMWSMEPVRVADTSGLQRVGPQPAAPEQREDDAGVDGLITGAIAAEAGEMPQAQEVAQSEVAPTEVSPEDAVQAQRLQLAHDRWCEHRFRSYRAEDGTYQPYGGGRQLCQSPYMAELDAISGAGRRGSGAFDPIEVASESGFTLEGDGFGSVIEAVDARNSDPVSGRGWGVAMTRDHIQSCFDRYRSYRPEDNTYQPYDGGPRRQCE